MRAFLLVLSALLLGLSGTARAASVAYIDKGEVWLSSLDGAQKVRLAGHVVNSSGETEKWQDVTASDGGRIVATRIVPNRNSRFGSFKVWEPDGTSTVEGPLNAPNGWGSYTYPLSFDITADGKHLVYGYHNSSSFCCPTTYGRGTYVRPATNSLLEPISRSGMEHPTIVGNRVIAHSGLNVYVQDPPGAPYGPDFRLWINLPDVGLELRRTDVAANGQLAAFEAEQWGDGTQTVGKILVLSIQGIDQPVGDPAVNCFVPASGVAEEVSLSQDARALSWTDGQGLKVAGAPTTAADPCVMRSPPVVISPTGEHSAIGGASIAAFLPPASGGGGGTTPPSGGGGGSTPAPPAISVPAKVKLAASGLGVKVTVSGAGKVKVTATVPAKAMGRKGKPVTIGTGSATAKGAGKVTVKLRLTAAAKKRLKKLKGAKMTLKVVHNGRTATRTVTLR